MVTVTTLPCVNQRAWTQQHYPRVVACMHLFAVLHKQKALANSYFCLSEHTQDNAAVLQALDLLSAMHQLPTANVDAATLKSSAFCTDV